MKASDLEENQPIKLSPDLFAKAGFVWDSFFDGYVQGKILIKKIRRKYQVYWHLNQLTRIQYVHELQNLWHSIHHTELTL